MCESFEELDLKKQQMNYVRRQVIIASVTLLKFFYFLPFLHRIAHYLHRNIEFRVTIDCISRKSVIRTQSNILILGLRLITEMAMSPPTDDPPRIGFDTELHCPEILRGMPATQCHARPRRWRRPGCSS